MAGATPRRALLKRVYGESGRVPLKAQRQIKLASEGDWSTSGVEKCFRGQWGGGCREKTSEEAEGGQRPGGCRGGRGTGLRTRWNQGPWCPMWSGPSSQLCDLGHSGEEGGVHRMLRVHTWVQAGCGASWGDGPPGRGSPWGRGSWGCAESEGPVRWSSEDTQRH